MSQSSQLKLTFIQIYQKYIKKKNSFSKSCIKPCSVTQVGVCSSSSTQKGWIKRLGKLKNKKINKKGGTDKEQEKRWIHRFLLSDCGTGSIRAAIKKAEDGQNTQRKGLVAVWNNRKTDRDRTAGQGVKERKRLGNTGKREGKQRPKGRVADNCAHLCRHVNTDTDIENRLSKYSVKFWI